MLFALKLIAIGAAVIVVLLFLLAAATVPIWFRGPE